jgi:hypothetical protein
VPPVAGADGGGRCVVVVCVAVSVAVAAVVAGAVVVVVGVAGVVVVGAPDVPLFVGAVVVDDAGFAPPATVVCLVDVAADRLATNVDPWDAPGVSTGDRPVAGLAACAAAAIAVTGPFVHVPAGMSAELDPPCDGDVFELDVIGET